MHYHLKLYEEKQIQGDADIFFQDADIFFQVFGLSFFGPKMLQVDEM